MSDWVIGVDPSASKNTDSAAIGWATFKDGKLIATGELTPDPPYFSRVRQWLKNKFIVIQNEHDSRPSITVAVETAYLGANPSIFMGLIQCQSHLCAITLEWGFSFRYISPLMSFQAATGMKKYRGKGTRKEDIQTALLQKYPSLSGVSGHEFDAAAIAEAIILGQQKEHSK